MRVSTLAVALCLASAASATSTTWADESNAGDPSKGKQVFEVCTVCHGAHAEGNEDLGAPRLAGQHSWYLVTQLQNFRAGIRGTHDDDDNGQVMQPMAAPLSDADIDNVVAYIATLDPNYKPPEED